MDRLIAYLNAHTAQYGINAFYSTPSNYVAVRILTLLECVFLFERQLITLGYHCVSLSHSFSPCFCQAKHAANLTWSLKTDDHFPYCDNAHSCWTGYFVSRPALKGYIHDMSGYTQVCLCVGVVLIVILIG